ncbi:MAG: hypothetical protein AB1391_04230 [Candidatus Micrarchaeota archaeon]
MRGYISFLLILGALAILVVLSNSYNNSKSIDFSKAIALERMEQLSLDAKRNMLIAAKYGAILGFLEYVAELLGSETLYAFDINKAKEHIKSKVHAFILSVRSNQIASDPDYEFSFWCGKISDENDLGFIAEKSIRSGAPQMCNGGLCWPISSPECKDFISVEIKPETKKFSIVRVGLGSKNFGETPKIFGITIYSKKFNVSKVSYIPTSENVFQSPYVYETN